MFNVHILALSNFDKGVLEFAIGYGKRKQLNKVKLIILN